MRGEKERRRLIGAWSAEKELRPNRRGEQHSRIGEKRSNPPEERDGKTANGDRKGKMVGGISLLT